ncbi:hypothetical protein CspeluHIS016_0505450 [Cutaneotrichosporon spelunceum]|uniref:Myb-like domain-containing protein n=1 Tax=Cutaneotrichosporon spelunceum TaxID=1672016 RepID=A0AAD3TX57_9TREE|nr:hypothetical protein CspeluHIS016_0505450 [Cutaneotrichosporon spelunceum]
MLKRKHSPSPSSRESADVVLVKMDATPHERAQSSPSDDQDVKPQLQRATKPKKPAKKPTTTKAKAKSGGARRGRKPGVSYASKKWRGAELQQLFVLGLGGGESGTVPSSRFEGMPGRSVSQCTNAWRQRVIPTILKALGEAGESGEAVKPGELDS